MEEDKKPFDHFLYQITEADLKRRLASPGEDDSPEGPETSKKTKLTRKYDATRLIKAEWFLLFPWLEHDIKEGVFRCSYCVRTNKQNIFVAGKSTAKPKKDDFVKHERVEDHRLAAMLIHQNYQEHMEVPDEVPNMRGVDREALIAVMRTLLFVAQEDLAASKLPTLVNLLISNGAPAIQQLTPETRAELLDPASVDKMHRAMKGLVDRQLVQNITDAGYYSVSAVQTTDEVSYATVLIVYVRFVSIHTKEPETHFLGLRELPETTAGHIYDNLSDLLQEKGLDVTKMACLGIHGDQIPPVDRETVVSQFKQCAPRLLANHCFARCLVSTVEHVATNHVTPMFKHGLTLSSLKGSLRRHPELRQALGTGKLVPPEAATRIKAAFSAESLNVVDCSQSLADCLPALLSCIQVVAEEADESEKEQYHYLVKKMSSFRFFHLTALMADAVDLLSLLSRAMQVANPMYVDIKDQLASCVSALGALKQNRGCNLASLSKVFPQHAPVSEVTAYQGHPVKDTQKHRDAYAEGADEFIEELTASLDAMLPDASTLEDFDSLWTKAEGERGIQKIIDLYGRDATSADGETHRAIVQPTAALQEWYLLQGMVDKLDGLQALYRFLQKNEEVYPNMAVLVRLALTIPVTTTNLGLDRFSAISSANVENPIGVRAIEQRMTLSIEARPYEGFNYDQAFYDEWCRLPVYRPDGARGGVHSPTREPMAIHPLSHYDNSDSL